MPATRSSVDGILKEIYEGDVNDALNEEEVVSRRLEKTSDGVIDTVGGKRVVFPVRHRRNTGISYRAENTQLAAAGQQGYVAATEDLKYGYGRFSITGPAMELAETNQQAFMSALDGEMDNLKGDVSKDRNRIVCGHPSNAVNSTTGILAKITAGATSATQAVDNTQPLEVGMIVDLVVESTGTPIASGTAISILSVNDVAGTIVLSASVTTLTTTAIVRTGNYGQEPYGLTSLVNNTGTLHGINSATAGNEFWRSVVDTTTTTLTENAMISLCDQVRRRAGGGRPTAIFCSLGVRRAYYNLMTASRRFVDPKVFDGGLVGLTFNHGKEIPVVEDVDLPKKAMYFINEKSIKIYRRKDWYFEDSDGAILKWDDNYDRFQGLLKCYWQMATGMRNNHGVMNNITEPA
jgi:hypothetical protein